MLLVLFAQLALEPQPFTLVVRDRFGRAVADVAICAVHENGCVPLPGGAERLAAPGATLRIEAPAFEPLEVKAEARVELTLRAKGSISARALSPDEKRPLDATFALAEVKGARTFTERALVEKRVALPPRPKSADVTLDDIPPGTYVLSWSGADLARGERVVTVRKDESRALGNLAVERGVAVSGAVRDEIGTGLAGVAVSLSQEAVFDESVGLVHRTTTAADGTFQLRGVGLGEKLRTIARRNGFLVERGVWGGETRLEIVLQKGQTVTGVVKDAEGEALPGVVAVLSYRSESGHVPGDDATTDADGRFVLTRTARPKGLLTIRPKGFRPLYRDVDEQGARSPKEVDLGELVLSHGRTVSGTVTRRSTGEPVPDALVVAERSTPIPLGGADRYQTSEAAAARTEADGHYEIPGLPDDAPLRIRAAKDGFAIQTLASEVERDVYDFVLSTGGRVEGTVCGPPWEIASSVIWVGGSSAQQAKVDAAGRFVLENREAGPLRLSRAWVIRNPYQPAQVGQMSGLSSATVEVKEDETVPARIACDGIPVSGTVTLDGKPLASHRGIALVGEDGADDEDFLTDEAGRFSFRARKPGLYRFDVHGFATSTFFKTPDGLGCQVPPGGTDTCAVAVALPSKTP